MSTLTFPSIEFTNELRVTSNSTWTITLQDLGDGVSIVKINDAVIGSGTYQGSGNEDVRITFLANSSGLDRQVQLTLTSPQVDVITLKQSKAESVTRVVVVLNNNVDNGHTATQAYTYTSNSGSDVEFPNTLFTTNTSSLFNSYTDYEGMGSVPVDGDTVDLKALETGTATQQPFSSSLGSRMLFLVTDDVYNIDSVDSLVSAATNVTPTLAAGTYTSRFTYTRSNKKYLYLIYDYRNDITASGAALSMASGVTTDTTFNVRINFTAVAGRATIGYNANTTANTFILKLNDNEVFNSGAVTGSGTIDILKTSLTDNVYDLQVLTTGTDDGWSITPSLPSLTSFSYDVAATTFSLVCANTASTTKYHNGLASLPVIGDLIYENPFGTSLINGSNLYHKVDSNNYVKLTEGGVVIDSGVCTTCAETAVPVINSTTINGELGVNIRFVIDATNNPKEFAIVSTCLIYELNGGDKGAFFTYTDCNSGLTKSINVQPDIDVKISSSSSPVLVSGTGTSVSGAISTATLPPGLNLDTLTGQVDFNTDQTGIYTFTMTATNCFGRSLDTLITINILQDALYQKYNMDISNPETTSTLACSVIPSYAQMYHNGVNAYPEVNDFIYQLVGVEYISFNGGYKYYITDELTGGKNNILRIDSIGQVVEKAVCP
tara:strand:+ start:80 stop:2065 length:1986 start_codon:yes stop_codon:yes gene_type:complete